MGYNAIFSIKGYGEKETCVSEYIEGMTALAALAILKETYGDKLVQVSVLDEACDCGCSGCDCAV